MRILPGNWCAVSAHQNLQVNINDTRAAAALYLLVHHTNIAHERHQYDAKHLNGILKHIVLALI